MLAQNGYVVLADNRGTGGKGRNSKNNIQTVRKLETIDQIDAANYFGRNLNILTKKNWNQGWSYGGYMSSLCITKRRYF